MKAFLWYTGIVVSLIVVFHSERYNLPRWDARPNEPDLVSFISEFQNNTRLFGSREERDAMGSLLQKLGTIRDECSELNNGPRIEVELPLGNGEWYYARKKTHMAYTSVVNILVTVRYPQVKEIDDFVVISGHYDSALGSPGAADDLSSVAIMHRLMEQFGCSASEHYPKRPRRNLALLFTSGEECGLIGADQFVKSHGLIKKAKNGSARLININIESVGAGGRLFLFRIGGGPDMEKLLTIYAESVSFPSGNVFAQDMFQQGLLSGDTDFTRFKEAMQGFDVAFSENGYLYHTSADRVENMIPGSLEAGYQQVRDLAKGILKAELLPMSKAESQWSRVAFFDFYGWMFVVIPGQKLFLLDVISVAVSVLAILSSLVAASCRVAVPDLVKSLQEVSPASRKQTMLSVWFYVRIARDSGVLVLKEAKTIGTHLVLLCCVWAVSLSFCWTISYFFSQWVQSSWFSSRVLAFGLYGAPSLIAALLVYYGVFFAKFVNPHLRLPPILKEEEKEKRRLKRLKRESKRAKKGRSISDEKKSKLLESFQSLADTAGSPGSSPPLTPVLERVELVRAQHLALSESIEMVSRVLKTDSETEGEMSSSNRRKKKKKRREFKGRVPDHFYGFVRAFLVGAIGSLIAFHAAGMGSTWLSASWCLPLSVFVIFYEIFVVGRKITVVLPENRWRNPEQLEEKDISLSIPLAARHRLSILCVLHLLPMLVHVHLLFPLMDHFIPMMGKLGHLHVDHSISVAICAVLILTYGLMLLDLLVYPEMSFSSHDFTSLVKRMLTKDSKAHKSRREKGEKGALERDERPSGGASSTSLRRRRPLLMSEIYGTNEEEDEMLDPERLSVLYRLILRTIHRELLRRARKKKVIFQRVFLFLLVVFLVSMCVGVLNIPYSRGSPKRVVLQHIYELQDSGDVNSTIFFGSSDLERRSIELFARKHGLIWHEMNELPLYVPAASVIGPYPSPLRGGAAGYRVNTGTIPQESCSSKGMRISRSVPSFPSFSLQCTEKGDGLSLHVMMSAPGAYQLLVTHDAVNASAGKSDDIGNGYSAVHFSADFVSGHTWEKRLFTRLPRESVSFDVASVYDSSFLSIPGRSPKGLESDLPMVDEASERLMEHILMEIPSFCTRNQATTAVRVTLKCAIK